MAPAKGLGGSPLALKNLGPEHHLQKQGLQGLFEHWLPAFLAKGVVVEECWQQCRAKASEESEEGKAHG